MYVPDRTQTNGRRPLALASSVVPIALFLVSPEVGEGGILELNSSEVAYQPFLPTLRSAIYSQLGK